MLACHLCARPWNDHAADCRVVADLQRLRRVHDRLVAEGRDDDLVRRMARYLDLFGDLPCQRQPDMPDAAACAACGHKDVCVILPAGGA
ncbi:MAG: hypothetical protein AB1918_00300 [Pseudomonadota bacterium]